MYAYLEASQRRYNKKAVIQSPTYGGSFADCTMTFYYHMYGANVGSLWLRLTDINGTTVMWRYSGGYLAFPCFHVLCFINRSIDFSGLNFAFHLHLNFFISQRIRQYLLGAVLQIPSFSVLALNLLPSVYPNVHAFFHTLNELTLSCLSANFCLLPVPRLFM